MGKATKQWAVMMVAAALGGIGCTTNPDDGNTMNAPIGAAGTGVPGTAGMGLPGTSGTGAPSAGGGAGMGIDTGMAGSGAGPTQAGSGGSGDPLAGAGGSTAGSGGSSAGTGGGPMGGSGGMGPGGDDHMPACMTDPTQLVIVGDSYIQWVSHTFPTDLAELADQVGVWDVAPPRGTMYAVGGTSIGTGQIPGQLTTALRDQDNVKFVVMDGGGNDILLNVVAQGCKATGSSMMQVCRDIVNTAIEASRGMLPGMMAEGVTDLIYFYYPHVPLNTALGGPNPNEILDYALPLVREYCNGVLEDSGGQIKCHFVDMIPVFEGHSNYFAAGDLHPNNMGSAAMAAAVWQVMEENCVAQPASSGCCTP